MEKYKEFLSNHWISVASFAGMGVGMFLQYAHLDVPILIGRLVVGICAIIFVMSIIYPIYEYIIKPFINFIKRIKQMLPIISMTIGLCIFAIGLIWFCIQQINKQPLIVSTPAPQAERAQPINIPHYPIDQVNAMARLSFLKMELSYLENYKKEYELTAPKMLDRFINPTQIPQMSPGRAMFIAMGNIERLSKEVYGEEIKFNEINKGKYDTELAFEEEGKIADGNQRIMYRREKCKYLSNKDIINNLIAKLTGDINKNEALINEYGKSLNKK